MEASKQIRRHISKYSSLDLCATHTKQHEDKIIFIIDPFLENRTVVAKLLESVLMYYVMENYIQAHDPYLCNDPTIREVEEINVIRVPLGEKLLK